MLVPKVWQLTRLGKIVGTHAACPARMPPCPPLLPCPVCLPARRATTIRKLEQQLSQVDYLRQKEREATEARYREFVEGLAAEESRMEGLPDGEKVRVGEGEGGRGAA